MTGIDPTYTLGQLGAARDRLVQQLQAEALLDANGRLAFPVAPLRIGLVTAAGSAAHADFCEELRRSGYAFEVVFVATPVQGMGAAARVAGAIRACAGHRVDVIAVVRGGGARTDLVAFDDAAVARAIATVAGPGGHRRRPRDRHVGGRHGRPLAMKTPTACAGLLIERVAAAERRAEDAWGGIAALAQTAATASAAPAVSTRRRRPSRPRCDATFARPGTARRRRPSSPAISRVAPSTAANTSLARHVQAATLHSRHRLRSADRMLDDAEVRVRLLDPATALARGWTITTDESGALVRSTTSVSPGVPAHHPGWRRRHSQYRRVGHRRRRRSGARSRRHRHHRRRACAVTTSPEDTVSDPSATDADPGADDSLGYAEAVAELERILDELADDDVDVDVLSSKVARAAVLIRLCRGRIRAAELQVNEIVADLESVEPLDRDRSPLAEPDR
jgi:exodeoxyribonuclease VII small subunit